MCPPPGSAWRGWSGIAVASLMQLVWRHPLASVAARAIAVPGGLFTAICLVSGSLWGRPTWGTWWEWDGRLTSMLILLFPLYRLCGARVGSRQSRIRRADHRHLRDHRRDQPADHPLFGDLVEYAPSGPVDQPQRTTIDSSLLWPLPIAVLGFSLLFGSIVLMRMRALIAENRVEARLRRMAMS